MSADLSGSMSDWVEFYSRIGRFELSPDQSAREGLNRVTVVLDDGKDQREYFLSFFVIDTPNPEPPEPPRPPIIIDDPEPWEPDTIEPEPDTNPETPETEPTE